MKKITLLIPLLAVACFTLAPVAALAGNQPHCRVGTPEGRAFFDQACAALGIINENRCCTIMMRRTAEALVMEEESEVLDESNQAAKRAKRKAIRDAITGEAAP
jgi:hypothetical protein